MQIKSEFKEMILSSIKMKYKPVEFDEHSRKDNIEEDSIASEDRTFYETLQSNDGFLALQSYYIRVLNENRAEEESGNKPLLLEMDEFVFGKILMVLIGKVDEIYVLDTFDTLDSRCKGTIGFKEFYLMVLVLSAKDEGQLVHALYLHGQRFFDIISAGQEIVSEELLLKFGRILGFREDILLDNLIKSFPLNAEDFVLFYFSLFSQYDSTFETYHSKPVVEETATPKPSAPRVQGGCCTGRICAIF